MINFNRRFGTDTCHACFWETRTSILASQQVSFDAWFVMISGECARCLGSRRDRAKLPQSGIRTALAMAEPSFRTVGKAMKIEATKKC